MSYAKQNFKPGDVLLASQLNAMDDQIALNEAASKDFITSAGEYAAAAAASATAAETSAEAAEAAAGAASDSADAASDSEVAANNSATAAALSAQGAYASAAAADASETAAATSAQNAADSATAASSSATSAESSAADARGSKHNAELAEMSATDSKNKAKTSEVMANLASTNAETAKNGAVTAKEAAETAKIAAESAQSAAETAKTAAETASTSASGSAITATSAATAASASETAAGQSATAAAASATAASGSASAAAQSAQDAQDVLDSIPPDYTAMTQDVTELKSAFNDSLIGTETFITHGQFAIGGLQVDGTLIPAQTTRVSSANVDKISFIRDITVNVASGYKWGYIPFSGTTPGSWSGWYTTPTTISANTEFVVQICRDPEGTEVANVFEFVNALTFKTKTEKQVNENAENIAYMKDAVDVKYDMIPGKYVDYRTGNEGTVSAYSVTGFVACRNTHLKVTTYAADDDSGICYYNKNKYMISEGGSKAYSINGVETVLIPPSDAYYIRISCLSNKTSAFKLSYYDTITDIIYALVANYPNNTEFANTIQSSNKVVYQANPSAPYNDFNTLPINRICLYTLPWTGANGISHAPDDSNGTVLTYSFNPLNDSGLVQIAVTVSGDVYSRIKYSSWTDWKNLGESGGSDADFSTDYSTLSVFENIGVVGDSFASGAISRDNAEAASDHYALSWPQILARKCGVDVYNYSVGGMSTRSFLTNTSRGLPKLLTDDPKNLYIICLGLNDMMIEDYLGDATDLADPSEHDTFYGNYGNIIEQIQSHAPYAKIILSTMPRHFTESGYAAFDTAIEEIAEYYSLPCMVTWDDQFFKSSFYTGGLSKYHPTAILYGGMAEAYQRLFSLQCIAHRSYFQNYVGGAS